LRKKLTKKWQARGEKGAIRRGIIGAEGKSPWKIPRTGDKKSHTAAGK